nr:hypothetical protein [uncultured Dyadobacter sp.]
MMSIFLKVAILALCLLLFFLFKLFDDGYSLELLSSIGQLMTGVAAIIAVFGGVYTMQKQVRMTAHVEWVKSFRIECADFLVLAQQIENASSKEELLKLSRHGSLIILMLNPKDKLQMKFGLALGEFVVFIMNSNRNTQHYIDEFSLKWDALRQYMMQICSGTSKVP